MLLLLSPILLWLLVAFVIYFVTLQLIPGQLLALLGVLILLILVALAFFNPSGELVSATWSFLSVPLKPLGLSLLLLLGALQLKNGQTKGSGKWLIWTGFLILLLSSMPLVAYQLAQQAELQGIQVEVEQRRLTPSGEQTAAAIVVLGQGTTQANLPYRTQIQLTDTGDRILYAAQLYQQQQDLGNTPIVIASAGPRADLEGEIERRSEARDIATLLQRFGIPASQIVTEPKGTFLHASAVQVEDILQQRGLTNEPIILVSSGINIRRAALTFSNLGIQVIPRPTDFYTFQPGATPRRRSQIEDFLPSAEALTITTRVVEEYFASIYYFLRGWLSPVVS